MIITPEEIEAFKQRMIEIGLLNTAGFVAHLQAELARVEAERDELRAELDIANSNWKDALGRALGGNSQSSSSSPSAKEEHQLHKAGDD